MSLVCCCSNPSCLVNGCHQAAALKQVHFAPYPPGPRIGVTVPAPPALTEEDIRRIIREELARGANP